MDTPKPVSNQNQGAQVGIAIVVCAAFFFIFISSFGGDDTSTSRTSSVKPTTTTNTTPPSTSEAEVSDVPVPGDEIFLKYDKETSEKIYVADSLETYKSLAKSYNIKDDEARWELILEGKVIAVPSGTKARILDYLDVETGAEQVRILDDGENYNFVGYVPRSVIKK